MPRQRRIKTRCFNAAVVVSLVLGIVTAVAWLRSVASETILLESAHGELLIIGIDQATPKDVREFRDALPLDRFLGELRTPLNINGIAIPVATEQRVLGFSLVRGQKGKV